MNKERISPAYAREYSEWIAKGQFDFQYQHLTQSQNCGEAIAKESPGLMALALGFFEHIVLPPRRGQSFERSTRMG